MSVILLPGLSSPATSPGDGGSDMMGDVTRFGDAVAHLILPCRGTRILVLGIFPAALRGWVPIPAFDQVFASLFLWKQRRKHPSTKYKSVKTTGLGRGTVILTVKWASLDFHFKCSSQNYPLISVLCQCASIYFNQDLCHNQQKSKKHHQSISKQ